MSVYLDDREQLIQKIKLLETENKFLKEYIRGTKEFKDFNKWIDDNFGGEEWVVW